MLLSRFLPALLLALGLNLNPITDAQARAVAPAPLQVTNLAPAFAEFWDQTQDLPMTERVARFKQQIASQFPEFYAAARLQKDDAEKLQDERIAAAIRAFPAIRTQYLQKSAEFAAKLEQNLQRFQQTFPDFRSRPPIYVLHSLGEMDGGTREFQGQTYLIFGIDGMVRYHQGNDEAPFFDHELFHVYHERFLKSCKHEGLWLPLWQEGLAVYVSQVLHPQASYNELLLDIPAGVVSQTEAQMGKALDDLEGALDSTDQQRYAALFNFRQDASGLPARRGYYLGYLIARDSGRTHHLGTLAKMNCEQAEQTVREAIPRLRDQYRSR